VVIRREGYKRGFVSIRGRNYKGVKRCVEITGPGESSIEAVRTLPGIAAEYTHMERHLKSG